MGAMRRSGYIRLHSIQTKAAWEELQRTGVLRGDWGRIIDPEFEPAYRWIHGEMTKRMRKPLPTPPLWAWFRYSDVRTKPDLRHCGIGAPGTDCVMLTLEVQRCDVLLSDFAHWHAVLNDTKLFAYDEDKVTSWLRIFQKSTHRCGPDGVQATLFEIRMEHVVHTQAFLAR